jgi:hypothetical protein
MKLLASELVQCDWSCARWRTAVLVLAIAVSIFSAKALAKGETTSAIVAK